MLVSYHNSTQYHIPEELELKVNVAQFKVFLHITLNLYSPFPII